MGAPSASSARAAGSMSSSRTTRCCSPRSRARPSTTASGRSSAGWRTELRDDSAPFATTALNERLFGPDPSGAAGTPRSMLLELRVENLLLIERAELRLEPGLNVITGETGAGKTVLAHALDLLLGGKPRPGIVRPGASEAYVEGVFAVFDELFEGDALAELRERLPEDVDEIVLGRRVSAEGRTRAFVQGRSASAADLRELGGRLLSFYGQHEHRRLTVGSAQLAVLDAFCGAEHLGVRDRYVGRHRDAAALRRRLGDLQARAGAL